MDTETESAISLLYRSKNTELSVDKEPAQKNMDGGTKEA